MRVCLDCRDQWRRIIGKKKYREFHRDGLRKNYPAWLFHSENTRHCQRHQAIKTAESAKRRAAKLAATPSWVNNKEIAAIYQLRSEKEAASGMKYEVDHIVPLRGKLVCGLHVAANLEPIHAKVNRKKGNRFYQ